MTFTHLRSCLSYRKEEVVQDGKVGVNLVESPNLDERAISKEFLKAFVLQAVIANI